MYYFFLEKQKILKIIIQNMKKQQKQQCEKFRNQGTGIKNNLYEYQGNMVF